MHYTDEQIEAYTRLIPGYDPWYKAEEFYFDHAAARHVLQFIPTFIKHVEGDMAGKPYELEDHERAVVANLFGWRRADGTRRYREVFYFIPRKNSKSTFASAIAIYVLYCSNEPGAQIYSIAAEREQAGICFRIAKAMINAEPYLKERAQIYQHSIVVGDRSYKALSAESNTKHGLNPYWVNDDETHAQRTGELIQVMETGMGARSQPCMFHTTTADIERLDSPCNRLEDKAERICEDPTKDMAFLPILFKASVEDDWHDEAVWHKANPNLGKSIKIENFRRFHQIACESVTEENKFKRLHLNIRTEQVTRWLPMDKWKLCCDGPQDPIVWRAAMLKRLEGETCEAAIDLGAVSDLTALVLRFKVDGKVVPLPFFWCPKTAAQRKDNNFKTSYMQWARDGFITLTEGTYTDIIDFGVVLRDVVTLASKYNFVRNHESGKPEIAVDRLFNGYEMITKLADEGFEPVAFGQGFLSMAGPTKRIEELVVGLQVNHGNNPALDWMARNAAVKTDPAGNMKIEKPERHNGVKVDGLVAWAMAEGRGMTREEQKRSVYATRGILRV